jgi:hypothetical protein
MEYYCHLCHDWLDANYSESHFDGVHGTKGMTIEKLQKRMAVIGGLDTRDEKQAVESEEERPVFITNNFRHTF